MTSSYGPDKTEPAPLDDPILSVENLTTQFHTFNGTAQAVDRVSFSLNRGETLGLVGESGCGKSVTANSIMRLIPQPPGEIRADRMTFDGLPLLDLDMAQMRQIRGQRISMIFQEPMTALNPVFTLGDQIGEMFRRHRKMNKKLALEQAVDMLDKVQIPAPEKRIHEYPHQLSGGMRQRAMIAMAMACDPEILIADEPTTALDVTIQGQIIDLMHSLKEQFNAAIMLITHDLGVVAEIAQRVVVMYAGNVMEEADTRQLFSTPLHPYTEGLLASIPRLGERTRAGRKRLRELTGIVPSLYDLPPGCRFEPRCSKARPICKEARPGLSEPVKGHRVRCFLHGSSKER